MNDHSPLRRARRVPAPCGLAAAVLLALAAPAAAGEPTLWQRVKADPRAAQLATMSPADKRAFARDYGIENLLPKTDTATIPVANCNDSGSGSLRAAVAAAASGDTVDATPLACSTISLTTGAIEFPLGDLSIKGRGPDALTITANDNSRVFTHTGTGALRLYGMTLEKGRSVSTGATPARGGCVYSSGSVFFGSGKYAPTDRQQGVVARHCSARAQTDGAYASGGAVFARRELGLFASVISGNDATGTAHGAASGGGVALVPVANGVANATFTAKYSEIRDNSTSGSEGGVSVYARQITLAASTIAGNTAAGGKGAALLHLPSQGKTLIANTTISGNSSLSDVGGLVVIGGQSIVIANSTVTGNSTSDPNGNIGGALLNATAIELESSIFCGNRPFIDLKAAVSGTDPFLVDGADNLVGHGGWIPSQGLVDCPDAGLVLAPLAGNGGLTRTHALLAASPAIDAGNNSQNLSLDQRGTGHPRVIGAAADIGAFERDPEVIFRDGFD